MAQGQGRTSLGSPLAAKVLGGLALMVVAAAGWLLLLGPKTAALAETHTAIQDTQDQNALLSTQLAALRAQADALPETRATAARLAELFPPTADQPGLFKAMNAAARRAGIGSKDITALSPSPPTVAGADGTTAVAPTDGTATTSPGSVPPAADLATQTVTVSFEGSYAQTERLLENLERMDRAFLITSITLTGGSDSSTLVTTIGGEMFVMPPAADPEPEPAVTGSPSARG